MFLSILLHDHGKFYIIIAPEIIELLLTNAN